MSAHHQKLNSTSLSSRELIDRALADLDHILPAQAPIQDFVHHNTLHGYQHLPFEEALDEAEKLTGICAYLPEDKNREFYRQGRINDDDLSAAFAQNPKLRHEEIVCNLDEKAIYRKDIYRIALLYDLQAINLNQLNWQIEELAVLDTVQTDVPNSVRTGLSGSDKGAGNPVRQLWESLCTQLDLKPEALHPEDMLDLSLEQSEFWLDAAFDMGSTHQHTQDLARTALEQLFKELGGSISLRGFVLALSGKDVLDSIRPLMIRLCASALDEGVAAWQLPECRQLGLYGAWRTIARYDAYPFLHELPDWSQIMIELPEDAIDNIILQLEYLELPQAQWEGYLRRLALELPGWAGMINWRQQHPSYFTANKVIPTLADYLAIRLTLDRLWLNQVCRAVWKCEAKVSALQGYFSKNLSEFVVRQHLYQGVLPEYLTQQAELLTIRAGSERQCYSEWQHLAGLIYTWQSSPMVQNPSKITVNDTVWRLFRLSQHLGLNAKHIQQLGKSGLLALIEILDGFSLKERSKVWLLAYERHYREDFFHALNANHNRGRWAKRKKSPDAQIVFCMDDREESFRRHLEELNPAIETLGAAGFFGVAMNYKGLDDARVTPLCPIVVTPAHEVQELPQTGQEQPFQRHKHGRKLNQLFSNLLHHGLRRNLVLSHLIINVMAPFTLLGLLAKSLIPKPQNNLLTKTAKSVSGSVNTQLMFTSTDTTTVATPEQPKLGFTESEQVDRVAGFLRNTGLNYGFAPLVVLMGHGSMSQNNPHLAAYDCGACSGRHGGPNARVFAAMANQPEIRQRLAERNIYIPDGTWFIGAEHNTCSEDISWYDTDSIPKESQEALTKLQQELKHAQHLSAHERCRRLASAPRNPELKDALAHIVERAADFSQARPELGHATNASAIVGRRSVTQGAFFDRRTFLISYDPTQDPDGKIVEGILLNVGPVGAGINLEYYFSTVNNDRLGCGTKVPHNIVGLFGVMEGTTSDLRTGLPSQMIEIHEAMRLQLVVEAKASILEEIYARQESLRELIAGGWILLSTIDPDTGEIFVFERGTGFVLWQAEAKELPVFEKSTDCYRNKTLPVAPALIKQSELVDA
ncbi:DUF2309 domain-containing protein [Methyloglobulus sp.]|uniref:DUF2309 domain-containing protein n=1 Tax=Methyloglobulus sp. TaxID=2518622 RepID=UPI0032B84D21